MALTNANTGVGSPTGSNIKRYGKGNWKMSAITTNALNYSTDGKEWFSLFLNCSPITLYNTELYVDTTSAGTINKLPKEIIPRYSRVAEVESNDLEPKSIKQATTADYYEGIL